MKISSDPTNLNLPNAQVMPSLIDESDCIVKPSSPYSFNSHSHLHSSSTSTTDHERNNVKTRLGLRSNGLTERAIEFGGGIKCDSKLLKQRSLRFADNKGVVPCHVKKSVTPLTANFEAYKVRTREELVKSLATVKSNWSENHDYLYAHEQLECIEHDLTVSQSTHFLPYF